MFGGFGKDDLWLNWIRIDRIDDGLYCNSDDLIYYLQD